MKDKQDLTIKKAGINGDLPELTPDQQKLADNLTHLSRLTLIHIVSGMGYVAAYKAAGGQSKKKSVILGSVGRMMSSGKTKAFYDSLIASVADESVLTRRAALEILTNQARTNIADVAEFSQVEVGEKKDGSPMIQTHWKIKDSKDLDKKQLAAICEVRAGKDGLTIKMHDQKAAIKQLGEILGWNQPEKRQIEVAGKGGEAIKTEEVGGDGIARRVAFLLAQGVDNKGNKG